MRIIAVVHLPFAILICLIGLVARSQAPNINSSTAFIYFIENYLHIGVKGLAIVGILAIAMSTADSWLNTISVLFAHGIAKKFILLADKQALMVARLSTFIIAILTIYLSTFEKGILDMLWFIHNFWEPLIAIPLIAGFLKFRTNSKSFVTSTIFAIITTSISGYIVGDLATVRLTYGTIDSSIGWFFGMHYWQKCKCIIPKYKTQNVYRAGSETVFYL